MNVSLRYPTKTGAPVPVYRKVGPLSLVLDCLLQETRRLYTRLLLLFLLLLIITAFGRCCVCAL